MKENYKIKKKLKINSTTESVFEGLFRSFDIRICVWSTSVTRFDCHLKPLHLFVRVFSITHMFKRQREGFLIRNSE